MVIRRYTFKLYPSRPQQEALERTRQLHSALYNALIEQRIDAYHRGDTYARCCQKQPGKDGGVTLSAFDQNREITKLRAEDAEYDALSRGSLEQTVKRVDLAFQAFFRRARQGAGAQSGFPRFKRCDGFGMREMSHGGWHFTGTCLRLKGVPGLIRARGKFPAAPLKTLNCDLKLHAGTWWISVVVEMPARMRCDDHRKSEITFNLIDEFARVRRVDGGHAPGPAETVYAAAKGRISLCGYPGRGDGPPQTEGDHGNSMLPTRPRYSSMVRGDAPPQTEGDRGHGGWPRPPGPSHAGQQATGRRGTPSNRGRPWGSAVARSRACSTGNARACDALRGRQVRRCPPQTEGDHGAGSALPGPRHRRSSCRYKARQRLRQRREAHAARRRRELLHVWTTDIARNHSHLVLIAPPIAETTKSGRGSIRDPGAAVAVKADVNRHILDQAPAMAIAMLQYKLIERDGSVEHRIDETARAMVGNILVEATKGNRKLRRTIRNASRSGRSSRDGKNGADPRA